MKQWNLNGKMALITGASKGIGKSIAEEFLILGAKVIMIARNETEINKLVENQELGGCSVIAIAADLTLDVECQKIKHVIEKFGSALDVLVNNVGTTIRKKTHEYIEDEYRSIIDMNVISLLEICKFGRFY